MRLISALSARRVSVVAVAGLLIATVGLLLMIDQIVEHVNRPKPHRTFALSLVPERVCGNDGGGPSSPSGPSGPSSSSNSSNISSSGSSSDNSGRDPIPNLVHYVWLLRKPGTTAVRFDFSAFVSVYSAHLLLKPDRIYFHTDASVETWELARTEGDAWTRRVLAIPGVTRNQISDEGVAAPSKTSQGVEISQIEHRADFARVAALREFGGVYMDTDVIPLRDMADLRTSGFAAVVGVAVGIALKNSGFINNGLMLSRPHSGLMAAYLAALDVFFDTQWFTPIDLLTDMAFRASRIPGEVLILHPTALAPVSWEFVDIDRLFRPHAPVRGREGGGGGIAEAAMWSPRGENGACWDLLAWLKERDLTDGEREDWEMDMSSSYALHGFDNELKNIRGWDGDVNLAYVLARRSNYARAVYPAVANAVAAGVIPLEEARLAGYA